MGNGLHEFGGQIMKSGFRERRLPVFVFNALIHPTFGLPIPDVLLKQHLKTTDDHIIHFSHRAFSTKGVTLHHIGLNKGFKVTRGGVYNGLRIRGVNTLAASLHLQGRTENKTRGQQH